MGVTREENGCREKKMGAERREMGAKSKEMGAETKDCTLGPPYYWLSGNVRKVSFVLL